MDGAYVKREPKDDGSSTVLSSISKKDKTKAKSRTEKKKRSRGAASGNAPSSDDTNDADPRTLGSDSNDDSDDDDEGDSDVYEVEKVVGHRYDQNNKLSYHIKWKDYPDEESSWEQESSVFCLDMVKEYWKLYCDQGGSKTDPEGSIGRPSSSSLSLNGRRKTNSSTGSENTKPSSSGSKRGKAGSGKGSSGGRSGRISSEPLLPDLSPLVKSSAAAAVVTTTTTATTTTTSATSTTSSKRARTMSPERQLSTSQSLRRSSNSFAVVTSAGSGKSTILSTTTKLAKVTPETRRGATVTTTASALGPATTTTTEQQQQSLDNSLPRRLTSVGPVLITEENWEPPSHWDSWDDLVERVEAIETRSADKHDRSTMFVHLRWKSGNRMTLHPLQEIHDKAPRRLIDFYESHLQFQESK
ncbi:hypothetical protein BGZ90_001785 [Linnemannia elongata]|nr:hypothetical protein BGZ90_001785 [Linnemannia elongata]